MARRLPAIPRKSKAGGFSSTVADAGATARVEFGLMWNQSSSALAIDVTTNDSPVTLEGDVKSQAERELCVETL